MGSVNTMNTNLGHFILLLLGFLPGSFCCEGDGSEAPVCDDWVNSAGQPFYFPHQSNCSKFWMCGPNLTPCLFECPPMSGGGSLYFNAQLNVCDWPDNVECTAEEAGESEECEEGEECTPSEEEEGEEEEGGEEEEEVTTSAPRPATSLYFSCRPEMFLYVDGVLVTH